MYTPEKVDSQLPLPSCEDEGCEPVATVDLYADTYVDPPLALALREPDDADVRDTLEKVG